MEIKSIFSNNQRIPLKYTCNGKNISPPLKFFDIPKDTKSLLLILDDPDSPSKVWVHWLLYNITPDTKGIKEDSIPENSTEGINDFGKVGYGGPCPNSGTHRYYFKLYALDINFPECCLTKADLEKAMSNHILDKAIL